MSRLFKTPCEVGTCPVDSMRATFESDPVREAEALTWCRVALERAVAARDFEALISNGANVGPQEDGTTVYGLSSCPNLTKYALDSIGGEA